MCPFTSVTKAHQKSDLIIMAITSKTHKVSGPTGYAIVDWEKAGLLKPSLMNPAISTMESWLIIKKLGSFSLKDINLLDKVLMELFGLEP